MKTPFRLFSLALVALSLLLVSARAADDGPKLGIQTWSLRFMTFEQVVEFAQAHHIKYLEMIAAHMDPKAPLEETMRKKAILDKAGLVCYSFGVNGTSMNKEENRKLFVFAKAMGIKVIAVEPKNLAEWDNLEELVKEYDIKLAIHNHGTGTMYGDPETVKKVLAARDVRIGACLDIGWVTAAGFDAAKIFREYNGRVYDMHMKDKIVDKTAKPAATEPAADGKKKKEAGPVVLDVEIGKGQANYKGLFEEMKKAKWSGVMAIETDNAAFQKDPGTLIDSGAAMFKANVK